MSEFACHRCGNCCRGDGDVALTPDDVTRLAAHAGLAVEAYLARYTRQREDGATCLIDQGTRCARACTSRPRTRARSTRSSRRSAWASR
ncbi:YkgJ family cysteine cluster protein [Nannocystis pusilla]|uniref:YkgJ family cysteine cluster protein n=1 Tax=Nannocystis pusilla TaxID=889268 RepID=UPI003B78C16D